MPSPVTRRWERLPVDLPVKVFTSKGFSTTVVEGRGTEISQGGMVLYAGILLNPGDCWKWSSGCQPLRE